MTSPACSTAGTRAIDRTDPNTLKVGMNSEAFVQSSAITWERTGPGVRRQVLGHDPGLMLVSVRFEKGSIGPVHQHPHRQVSFVVAGRFEVRIGDETCVLAAGDCFIVPPDVPHGALALEEGALVDVFTPPRADFLPVATADYEPTTAPGTPQPPAGR